MMMMMMIMMMSVGNDENMMTFDLAKRFRLPSLINAVRIIVDTYR